MAHTSITPTDDDRYYAGDAIDIRVEFIDAIDETPVDISGGEVEFLIKESRTDTDADALLTKTSANGGVTIDGTDVDPTQGEAVIHVETDDTDPATFLTETVDGVDERVEQREFFCVVRLTDADGNRTTTIEATWPMHAS